jgi:mono/diheme cytochrome c family protein
MRVHIVRIGMMLAGFAGFAAAGHGATTSAIDRGRALAERQCARCHAIGETGASPLAPAPPFRILYRRYPVDALRPAFLRGLEVGHRDMPRFVLSPGEVTDLIAFLDDIDPCSKPSSDKAAMARCFAPVE